MKENERYRLWDAEIKRVVVDGGIVYLHLLKYGEVIAEVKTTLEDVRWTEKGKQL